MGLPANKVNLILSYLNTSREVVTVLFNTAGHTQDAHGTQIKSNV